MQTRRLFLSCCCLGLVWGAANAASAADPAPAASADFVSLFDGRTLDGWDGDPTYWRVEDGCLVGEVTPETILKRNSFIIWRGGAVGDFELKLEYLVSERGNSGVNYRSLELADLPYAMRGYQADIDGGDRWTGNLYEERGRTFLALRGQRAVVEPGQRPRLVEQFADPDALQRAVVRKGDWNAFHIIVRGDHHRIFLNGTLLNEAWDRDPVNGPRRGLLGMQVHIGPPMTIRYRNIQLAQFPAEDEANRLDPLKDFAVSDERIEELLNFPTREGLEFTQLQQEKLTAPPPPEPIDGQVDWKLTSRLHLVRHDLGRERKADLKRDAREEIARDIVLIDGETVVRLPDPDNRRGSLNFDDVYEWTLHWSGELGGYAILDVARK